MLWNSGSQRGTLASRADQRPHAAGRGGIGAGGHVDPFNVRRRGDRLALAHGAPVALQPRVVGHDIAERREGDAPARRRAQREIGGERLHRQDRAEAVADHHDLVGRLLALGVGDDRRRKRRSARPKPAPRPWRSRRWPAKPLASHSRLSRRHARSAAQSAQRQCGQRQPDAVRQDPGAERADEGRERERRGGEDDRREAHHHERPAHRAGAVARARHQPAACIDPQRAHGGDLRLQPPLGAPMARDDVVPMQEGEPRLRAQRRRAPGPDRLPRAPLFRRADLGVAAQGLSDALMIALDPARVETGDEEHAPAQRRRGAVGGRRGEILGNQGRDRRREDGAPLSGALRDAQKLHRFPKSFTFSTARPR